MGPPLQAEYVSFMDLFDGTLAKNHVVISHRWMSKTHPDPDGIQLQAIQDYLAAEGPTKGFF